MSQVLYPSTYRPAVLVVTSFVAVCGLYALYSSVAGPPAKSALRRSNAIYRSRPRHHPSRISIQSTAPNAETPLGTLRIQSDEELLVCELGISPLPTMDQLSNSTFPPRVEFLRDVQDVAADAVLIACFRARSDELRERLAALGFRDLPVSMAARSEDAVRRCQAELHLICPDMTEEAVGAAIDRFLVSDIYRSEGASAAEPTSVDIAETELDEANDAAPEPSQSLKSMLYYIAEENVKRKAYEHRGIRCEECGETPIRGVRWHCLNCPDFDLCSTCESDTGHPKTHVFVKVKIPLPVLSQPTKQHPLWYPGDPNKVHSPLDAALKKRCAQAYGWEELNIEAFYDQFTCIANVPWPNDPCHIHAAIDRRAFNKALTSERWPQRFAPNAIYDQMFAFYDSNNDKLIGFEEFLSGLAYLRGPNRLANLRRALRGFDFDHDGFVDRADFLRLFRSKYDVSKQIIDDTVRCGENEQTRAAMEVIRSSQPISSILNQEEIPPGETRHRHGKEADAFGDMQPLPGTQTILDDSEPWPRDEEDAWRLRATRAMLNTLSSDRSRHHLSRFEEMLYELPGESLSMEEEVSGPDQNAQEFMSGEPESESDILRIIDGVDDRTMDEPLDQDLLWQIVEDALNELLNRFFVSKEDEHREAVRTRDERRRWRHQIDAAHARKRAFLKDLESAAIADPLIATAMKSGAHLDVKSKAEPDLTPTIQDQIVPTDDESLGRRERELSQRPLEQLLDATGYGTIDSTQRIGTASTVLNGRSALDSDPSAEQPQSAGRGLLNLRSTQPLKDSLTDPTLPQNRAGASSQSPSPGERSPQGELGYASERVQGCPSPQRLERLALLDDAEREAEERGGPGRLTYDEIERLTEADETRELRGLVTNWLEYATF